MFLPCLASLLLLLMMMCTWNPGTLHCNGRPTPQSESPDKSFHTKAGAVDSVCVCGGGGRLATVHVCFYSVNTATAHLDRERGNGQALIRQIWLHLGQSTVCVPAPGQHAYPHARWHTASSVPKLHSPPATSPSVWKRACQRTRVRT